MKTRTLLLLLVVGLGLVLFGCSSDETVEPSPTEPTAVEAETSEPVAEESEESAATADAAPAAEPASEGPTEATEAADETPDPANAFGEAQRALEGLESYRYTTSFLFVGEEEGDVESGSIELTGEIAGPDQKRLVWRDLDAEETFEVVQIGDEAWVREDGEWEGVPILVAEAMSQAALVYAPSVAWSGLFGELEPDAVYVGSDVVNGLPAHHYAATYRQWGAYWEGELVDATGDVWITEAGFPVKYHFSATGIDEDGDRGTVTWTMELSDVNAPIAIERPDIAAEPTGP